MKQLKFISDKVYTQNTIYLNQKKPKLGLNDQTVLRYSI